MQKFKKIALISMGALITLIVIVILFISPITKYLVEKYDEQYTGRQIQMDWAYVNPFTGYLHFNNFKVFELKSDSVFLFTEGVSINISMLKLFNKTYEINALTLDRPKGIITQVKKSLNFSDLIEKFSGKELSDTIKAVTHFNALDIKINDGEFHYRDKLIPINYFIKNVNIESTGKRWDTDTIAAKFSFVSGVGKGDMKGDMTINVENKDYRLAVAVNKFDLQILEQYLKDISNYGSFTANLDANIHSTGNLLIRENVTNSGRLVINDFHFGKTAKEDYLSFDKLLIEINEMSPKKHIYSYDSVILTRPYFKYERYDHLDNLQTMFGRNGSKITNAKANTTQFNLIIEIAEYIKMVGQNLFESPFKVNKLVIYNGDLKFNDFSRSEKFTMNLNPLNVVADSIDKNHKRAKVYLKSGIEPFGYATTTLSMNPKDTKDFDVDYHFEKLPVPMFNAYLLNYTSFPFDRGTIDLKGQWNVENGVIKSDNNLTIIDPRVSKKVKNEDRHWIPIPLIMLFIRERGNVIDYKIPITGDLKKPKFHLRDAIFDLLKNIFVKPPTTPYGIKVNNAENEIEKLLTLKWEIRQSTLRYSQKRFIKKMVSFLEKNPEASIGVYPQSYGLKEKEYILFFEAKKKYFLSTQNKDDQSFSKKDSLKVDKMSVKDTLFTLYLNKQSNGSKTFTVQDKCLKIVSAATINSHLNQLNEERAKVFMSYFKENKVANRIKMYEAKDVIPYNGFSFYKIDYNDKLPQSLIDAYHQMKELNNEAPRKKFKDERKKTKIGL